VAMGSDLRADIVRVIVEKMSDMCVGALGISHSLKDVYLLTFCVDSSLFYSTSAPFQEGWRFTGEGGTFRGDT